MSMLWCAVGAVILLALLVDVLWTTFLEGAGPISRRVEWSVGVVVLKLQRCTKSRRVIAKSGLFTVASTIGMWALLLWLGWSLVFCGDPGALVSAASGRVATVGERVYFVGYTIFTLGLGDFRPEGLFWQIATVITSGSGFLLFGLALAYLVPVVQAATQKRQLAVSIWSLGRSPAEIIIRAWNGADTTALGPHLVSLTAMLALLGESHLTYPVLHYYHSTKRSGSAAASVAALDEALTILECGLQRGCSLDLPALGAARESITEYLQTLKPALVAPAKEVPPSPRLSDLRDAGVPAVDDAMFEEALHGLRDRRKVLLALVLNEGWTWEAVWPQQGG